jgi:hypothetical protein
MPSFGTDLIDDREMDDLLAYVDALRAHDTPVATPP